MISMEVNINKINLYTSEKELLKKIKASKTEIQDIKVSLASFNPSDTRQDEYLNDLYSERKKYKDLISKLMIVKSKNKNLKTKTILKSNQNIDKTDVISKKYQSEKRNRLTHKIIIDNVI